MPTPTPLPDLTAELYLPPQLIHLCKFYVAKSPSPDHLFLLADALDELGRLYPTFNAASACRRRAARLREIAPLYA